MSYDEEFVVLIDEHRVTYDARYLWDLRCDRSAVGALWLGVPRVTRGLVALARA